MTRALSRSILMFLALWTAAACKQSEGDPCQVDSDCDDGLICCPALQTPRGQCLSDPRCPAVEETPSDAGGTTDDSGASSE